MNTFTKITVFVALLFSASIQAFVPSIASQNDAFATRSLGSSQSSSALSMTVLTYKGKKVDVKEGTPLKNACSRLGVKPKYSCKK